jgi:hypothetical protein
VSEPTFKRVASWSSYAIAALSIVYAVVYLGLVRPDPANSSASAIANGLIGLSGVLATFVVIAVGDRVGGSAGRWLGVVGVGWALLSAVHGTFSGLADAQGIDITGMRPDFAPTDPRGFATFGLAGLWSIVLGAAIASGGAFPRTLGTVALINGVDLIVLFLATAAGIGPLVLVTGGLAAVILGPIQWVLIGRVLGEP